MFKKKITALMICLITVLSLSLNAFAAVEDGRTEKDGVIFEIATDKDTYKSGDTAKFTITVTNTNDYDIKDLAISYSIPAGFEAKQSELPDTIDSLAAGQSTVLEFSTVVTSASEPASSGNFPIIIIIAIAVVVVIVIVLVIILKGKKGKKAVSMILAGTLIAGTSAVAITPSISADAEVSNSDYSRVSVHDPSIVKDPSTGTYYIFGSHKAFAKSDDLISWKTFSNNVCLDYANIFAEPAQWSAKGTSGKYDVSGNLWAPDVIYNEAMGKWCMYMSVNGDNWYSSIVLLTADTIDGDYTYVGPVMVSGFGAAGALDEFGASYCDVYKVLGEDADLTRYTNTNQACVNAIDPNVQYDENGNLWLTYGSWSAGIFQIKLDSATGLRDYNYTYALETNVSDPYLGYKIAGGQYNSGEGAYILKTDDYYYLFLSIGNLEASGGYNMRVYRSESINGPYYDENGASPITKSWVNNLGYVEDGQKTLIWTNTKKYTSNLGIKLLGAYNMYGVTTFTQVAQGHNSAFVDDDGKIYVVYHTRFKGKGEGHEVRVHQLFETETGWLAPAPYEYSGETLNTDGYTEDQVAGNYEFVVQRKDLVYAADAPEAIGESYFLNAAKSFTVNTEEMTLSLRADWFEDSGIITDSQGIVYGLDITLNTDGTISGYYSGTWEITNGSNVKMTIDGIEYSGVFIEQQNELTTRDMTMCFTLVGGDQVAWGVKNPDKN